jgi:hypothetical protein
MGENTYCLLLRGQFHLPITNGFPYFQLNEAGREGGESWLPDAEFKEEHGVWGPMPRS